ncbi:uroporphyrinogen-III C-methyltransferase [Paenibacillus gansuensis]|uniref:uroporphyrinogen-III C-methyltransferase n=1 Tax=Paenibacillus gansuensis TaxID=306542 RepID=A0ABW5PIV8_9BACL
MSGGWVSIVGAGPGDPDLITVKALKRIQSADVILYDRLVNRALLENARKETELIYVGKAPGLHSVPQEQIEDMIIHYAARGNKVVRLKGGDPFIFGRGGEELLSLAAQGIACEVIPGITSASGAAAAAGIPLTHRGVSASFACVTGSRCHGDQPPVRWDILSHSVDTLIIYMGVSQLSFIREQLLKSGKDGETPIALIENGTTSRQRVITGVLQEMDKVAMNANLMNPALIIIGEAVRVRDQIAGWAAAAEYMTVS